MIGLVDSNLIVETHTTRATFAGICLVSIQDAANGEEFLDRGLGEGVPGFELLLQNGQARPLGVHPLASQVQVHLGLARGIGYHYGEGARFAQQNSRPMIDATLKQGAIPTLIFRTADPLQEMAGEEAQYILERALS